MRVKISRISLFIFLSVLLGISGFMIDKELSERQREQEEFTQLAKQIRIYLPSQPQNKPLQSEHPQSSLSQTSVDTKPQKSVHKRTLSVLLKQNNDCIGWLHIPGTNVDYPVMHTPEQPQFYLKKNFYGRSSQSGVPFLDGRCSLESEHLILYGHNMRNGTMFGSLRKYTSQAYLKNHSIIELETESGCAPYRIFAIVVGTKQDDWYRFIHIRSQTAYEKQIEEIKNRALYEIDFMPEYGQQLLTLSTCYGSDQSARLLVIAAKR